MLDQAFGERCNATGCSASLRGNLMEPLIGGLSLAIGRISNTVRCPADTNGVMNSKREVNQARNKAYHEHRIAVAFVRARRRKQPAPHWACTAHARSFNKAAILRRLAETGVQAKLIRKSPVTRFTFL